MGSCRLRAELGFRNVGRISAEANRRLAHLEGRADFSELPSCTGTSPLVLAGSSRARGFAIDLFICLKHSLSRGHAVEIVSL